MLPHKMIHDLSIVYHLLIHTLALPVIVPFHVDSCVLKGIDI